MAIADAALEHADHRRGVVLVLSAGVFWSIAGLLVRLMESASEWQILMYRSVALCITLAMYLALRPGEGGPVRAFRSAGRDAAMAGLFLSGGFASWIFAMTHTTIANALFLLSASTFMAALLARLVLGERVRTSTLTFMLIGSAGVAVMVAEGIAVGTLTGNLCGLGAALAFAAFAVTLRRGKALDMTPAVCWAGIWGTLFGAFMVWISDQSYFVTRNDLALCALMGFVQVGLGLILFTAGSRYLPAAELTLLSLTEVVLGPIWVWLGVGEIPSPLTVTGGAVVLGAVAGQAIYSVRRRPPIGVM